MTLADSLRDAVNDAQQEAFEALAERYGIQKTRRHLLTGIPCKVIAQFARQHAFDMVVLGTVCQHGIDRFIGSTAESVLNRVTFLGAAGTVTGSKYLLEHRKHPVESPAAQLAEVITRTTLRHGITLVPSFAVGRAQLLMYHLYRLKQQHAIPDLPIYLNSPMATDVTSLYQRFRSEHRLSPEECEGMCHVARFVRTTEDSIELDRQRTPAVRAC
jgi:hypothetical protein